MEKTTKKDFTIKAIIQGKYLNLLYTYNRKKKRFKIANLNEEQINNFNPKSGYFKSNEAYAKLNNRIRVNTDNLERFAIKSKDKTADYIKENFKNIVSDNVINEAKRAYEVIGKIDFEQLEFDALLEKRDVLKEQLKEIEKEISIFNLKGHKEPEEILFRDILDKYENQVKNKIKDEKNRSPSQTKTWIKTLLEFVDATNTPLTFENMNEDFYYKYGQYLMFDSKHNMYNPTFSQHVKKLKTFLNYAVKRHHIKMDLNYKDWVMYESEKEVITLEDDELELLYKHKVNTTETEKKIIDLTWFQSWTGLRIGDVLASNWDLETLKAKNILKGKCLKNKGHYLVDLEYDATGRATEILKRYDYNMKVCSEKHYNETIKKLLKEVFEKHNIKQEKKTVSRWKFGQEFKTEYNFNDLFTSHCNRKFFINYLIGIGLNETSILQIIGSASASELQKSYVRKDEERVILNGKKVRERINN